MHVAPSPTTILRAPATASRQRGFSLIEVMVAMMVFGIGLLGLAGLLIAATYTGHDARLRMQATRLAGNMIARMRINQTAVWAHAYDGNYPLGGTTGNDCMNGCNPELLANHDKRAWSRQLVMSLPEPQATIACTVTATLASAHDGTCHLAISWSGHGNPGHDDTLRVHTTWRFTP